MVEFKVNEYMEVLCQQIVSTPWAEVNGDVVEHDRRRGSDALVNVRRVAFEILPGCMVAQR